MPERVSGGDAEFQGFCDGWNKWEGQAAPSGYSQSVGGYDEKLYAKVEAILAIKAAGALSASLGALAYKINENGQRMFAKVHGDVLQIDMIMESRGR